MREIDVHILDILGSQRMDVSYYKEYYGFKEYVPLSRYMEIKGGKRIPKGMSFSSTETNYLYLRLSDITDFENIDYSALKCISEELYNKLKRYEIENNQIVFSIAGTIGRVFIIKNIPEGKRVVLTENCAKLLPKNDDILPEYISLLLNCDFVQKQIDQNRIQTTIPKIGLDRIAKLKVPQLPSRHVQQEMINIFQAAQMTRLEKWGKAKQLLNDIDDYLLEKFQIHQEIFKVNGLPLKQKLSSIIGGRYDLQQFHPERINMIKQIQKREWCKLKDVVNGEKSIITSISREDVYIGMENIDGETGEYIPLKDKESISSAARFKEGDILFPKLRPYLNKVYRAQFSGCCSTEFHVFQAHNIHPDFLTIVLRSNMVLAQTKHLMTGNTLPRLQTTDIDNLIIPYPDITIQNEIVDYVSNIKNKAKQLQKEGNAMLEKAKQEIEKLIIG